VDAERRELIRRQLSRVRRLEVTTQELEEDQARLANRIEALERATGATASQYSRARVPHRKRKT
jgi:hypothetical protein